MVSTPSSASLRPSRVTTSTPVARDIRDDVVAGLLEYLDGRAADPAGRSGHRDLLALLHDCLLLSVPFDNTTNDTRARGQL